MKRHCTTIVLVIPWVALGGSRTQAQTTVTVELLTNNTFSPADVTVNVGDTVRWLWVGGNHNVESGSVVGGVGVPDAIFRSGNPTAVAGTTFEVLFDQGFLDANPVANNVYAYYCDPHAAVGMIGQVTVQANGCASDADCDDANDCTDDVCGGGTCDHTPNAVACDDADACTANDTCTNGDCVGIPLDCSGFADECNSAACDPGTGLCALTPTNEGGLCDDLDRCTVNDRCSGGVCAGSAAGGCGGCRLDIDCDDGDPCTDDLCDAGNCRNVANTASCDDGDPCTAGDVCNAGICGGTAIVDCCATDADCDDGDACTDDVCDVDTCVHIPSAGACDDGDPCTEGDTCTAGVCGGTPVVDCCATDADCDDSDACTDDSCVGNACTHAAVQGCGDSTNTSSGVCGAFGMVPLMWMFVGLIGLRRSPARRTG